MHISSETNFNYYSKFGQINTHEKPAWFFWWIFLFPHRGPLWGGHYGPEWRNISKAYECAFGSEVAETTERTQAISQENVFLKPICEQNSIV